MAKPTHIKRSTEMRNKVSKLMTRITNNGDRYLRLPFCIRLFSKRAERIANKIQKQRFALLALIKEMRESEKQERATHG